MSTVLAPHGRVAAAASVGHTREQEGEAMRFGGSVLFLALTAALAALAVTTARPESESGGDVRTEDVDAWFI